MPFVVIIIGASGIVAQIALVRELLVVFLGNELSIGLILGNWLIAEALGSYLVRRAKISVSAFANLIFSFSILLPVLIILTRIIRPIIGAIPGEIITIPTMCLLSLLILLPVGFIHGALFTLSVKFMASSQINSKSRIPGSVYIWENLGTIIGGLALSFILIPFLSSITIAFIFSIINLLAVIFLVKPQNILIKCFSYLCLFIFGYAIIISARLEHWTLQKNYLNYNILKSVNTIYNNITVVNLAEQNIFIIDGVPSVITPYPDQHFIEDFVNFPLLSHPNPQKILLIGSGAGGVISQLLQYDINQITYLELDPILIQTIKNFPTALTNQELANPRVKIINTDARRFLEHDTAQYDIILNNLNNPLSLHTNRFFTEDFYASCYAKLNRQGILVTISPGSTTYTSPLLNQIIQIHSKTLGQIFTKTYMLCGDFNLYLSYKDTLATKPNSDLLYARLNDRQIQTNLFSIGYLQYRLHNSSTINRNFEQKIPINRDELPQGLFYNLYYKNTISKPALKPFFDFARRINVKIITVFLSAVLFGILLVRKNRQAIHTGFAIFSTGFTAMVFTFVLSLGFQIRYGCLYYQISILLTAFIAGNVLGGIVSNSIHNLKKIILLASELAIVGLLLTMILLLKNSAYPGLFNTELDFVILMLLAGFVVGFQFPLANRLLNQNRPDITSIVGTLYASDLLGGFFGAMLVPVLLIPVIGNANTLTVALLFKIISAILVLTLR